MIIAEEPEVISGIQELWDSVFLYQMRIKAKKLGLEELHFAESNRQEFYNRCLFLMKNYPQGFVAFEPNKIMVYREFIEENISLNSCYTIFVNPEFLLGYEDSPEYRAEIDKAWMTRPFSPEAYELVKRVQGSLDTMRGF